MWLRLGREEVREGSAEGRDPEGLIGGYFEELSNQRSHLEEKSLGSRKRREEREESRGRSIGVGLGVGLMGLGLGLGGRELGRSRVLNGGGIRVGEAESSRGVHDLVLKHFESMSLMLGGICQTRNRGNRSERGITTAYCGGTSWRDSTNTSRKGCYHWH